MKKLIIFGISILIGSSGLFAQSLGGSAPMPSTNPPPPVLRKKDNGPYNRKFEVRVGPRVSFLTGDMRVGTHGRGSEINIWDDLKFDNPNVGLQFDMDYQPYKRFHLLYGMTYDNYDQSGTTRKVLTIDGNDQFNAGATAKANLDLFSWDVRGGWDIYRDDMYRLQVSAGIRAGYSDGKLQISGLASKASSGLSYGTRTVDITDSEKGFVMPVVGMDHRLYLARNVYIGGDLSFFGWDYLYCLNGDVYTGWDLNKNWGIRLGYAYDYVNYDNGNDRFSAQPLLGAAYVQAVWGF